MIGERIPIAGFQEIIGTIYPKQPNIAEGEKQYDDFISHRILWNNLSGVTYGDVQQIILPFLNKWRCRLSPSCASDLTVALKRSEQFLSQLRHLKIEDLDVIGAVRNNNFGTNQFLAIENVFSQIQKVKAGPKTVGFTATSKILHMAIPEFFVMSDFAIRQNYGCEDNGAGYANFMLRMNLLSKDLISQSHGNKGELISCSKWPNRTLARLIDSYNYTVFTLGKKPTKLK